MNTIARYAGLRNAAAVSFCAVLLLFPGISSGHAFPDHADPKVGSTVYASPVRVRIWFDSHLEPLFSTIIVKDAKGRKVDNGDGRVNPVDDTLLDVSLPTLLPGVYQVLWSVVARDGHKTDGDYTFTIR